MLKSYWGKDGEIFGKKIMEILYLELKLGKKGRV